MTDTDDLLARGIAALKAGQKAQARKLLEQVVRQDPHNESAWMWLSGAVEKDKERHFCLSKVLAINPNNAAAQLGLEHLEKVAQEKKTRPAPPAQPRQTPPLKTASPSKVKAQSDTTRYATAPDSQSVPEWASPPASKSSQRKGPQSLILIITVAIVLCVTCTAVGYAVIQQTIQSAIASDPEQAKKVGREIANYVVPPGYKEQAISMFGISTVILVPESQPQSGMVFMLMQSPGSDVNQEELEAQMRQSMNRQYQSGNVQMRVVGTQKVLIKGNSVTLTVSEGTTSDGQSLRQVIGVFPGKKGMAIIMVMGNKASWSQQTLNNFLASIR